MADNSLIAQDDILDWLREEKWAYQVQKFDYESEAEKPIEYWEQQFDSYIQRLRVFPQDSLQHVQAALKLAATVVAYCEHRAKVAGIPAPGVPSGTIEEW